MLAQKIINRLRLLFLAAIATSLPIAVEAQIFPDGSTSTTVTTEENNTVIEAGDRAGDNLFHSFQDFSIPTGAEASFNNAEDVSNIINRVTGGNISNIDGVLRANGSANVFLINPAGIVFGENGSLDIGGSFIGSSASSILFPENIEFSTEDLNTPILTIDAPVGLGFRDNPRDINVNGSLLEVANGETLGLIGGNVNIAGLANGSILALGGRIELGGLTEAGEIAIANSDNVTGFEIGSLSFPEAVARGDVTLTNFAFISTAGNNGGDIAVNASNITLEGGEFGGSQIFAGIAELGVKGASSGDIKLNATNRINITGDSSIFNRSLENTTGDIGNIEINTRQLNLDSGFIFSNLFGQGNTGKIVITASESLTLSNRSTIANEIGFEGVGNTGGIEIDTSSLEIGGISFIGAKNAGRGNAGDVSIQTDDFDLNNRSEISSEVLESGVGDAANISLTANTADLTQQTAIRTSTNGQGNAGNIFLTATTSTFFDDSSELRSDSLATATGNGGNIGVNAPTVTLNGGSLLVASTETEGNGGNISLNSNKINLNESARISAETIIGTGNAGTVEIETTTLNLADGASILSNTFGQGNANNLDIRARESIVIDDADLASSTASTETVDVIDGVGTVNRTIATGDGGNIILSTRNLSLLGGGQISTNTTGIGNGGNITIDATNSINLSGTSARLGEFPSGIGSNVVTDVGVGNAGKIEISTSSFNLRDLAFVETVTLGAGNAGNVILNADEIVLDNGTISSSVLDTGIGSGGNIAIAADSLELKNNASISAENTPLEATEIPFSGGNINLKIVDSLILRNNSQISAIASQNADGGNIDLNAQFAIAFPEGDNDIIANAKRGLGGNINISSQAVLGLEERNATPQNNTNDIDASSQFSLDGNVTINTPDNVVTQGMTELSTTIVEPEQTTVQACRANREAVARNGFTIKGKGGIIPEPGLPLNSLNVTIEGANPPISTIPAPVKTAKGKIQPARGIEIAKSGEIVLTAYRTNNSGERIPQVSSNCNRV